MLKKLSIKTNFILIGIVVGLFVGVSIRQALGDSTDVPGTVRADNLTVNTSGKYTNGFIVANGNALVAGSIGVGTTTPTTKLDVIGDIKSSTKICIEEVCIDKNQLKAVLLSTKDPFENIVTGLSGSASGPWIDNGEMCNPGTMYQHVTGVNKASSPPLKGCASPTASDNCLDPKNHRLFTSSEWINNTTVQTTLAVNQQHYPMGKYDIYLSFGDKVKKVASGSLKACGIQYHWVCVVVGPTSVDTSSRTCDANNVGERWDFGGHECTCRGN